MIWSILLYSFKRYYKVCIWYVRTRQWYGFYVCRRLRKKRYRKFLFQIVRERLALGRFARAGWPITYHLIYFADGDWSLEKHGPLWHVPWNETSQPGPNRSGAVMVCSDTIFLYPYNSWNLSLKPRIKWKIYKKKRGEVTLRVKKVILSLPVHSRTYFSTFPPCSPIAGFVCVRNRDRRWENSAVVKEGPVIPFPYLQQEKNDHAEMFASAALANKKISGAGSII